jgi:adiponectin receptor
MRDNIFITDGYRPQTNNYTDCFKSLFYLHNESGKTNQMGHISTLIHILLVNVYSHLIAFFIFVGFGLHFLWAQPFLESLTVFDYAYFFLFLVGALICLGFSSSFHCFACHSEKVAAAWNRCDYAGITFLTV